MVNDTATAVALDGYDIYVGGFSDDGPAIGGRRAFALAKVDSGSTILESFLPLVIR